MSTFKKNKDSYIGICSTDEYGSEEWERDGEYRLKREKWLIEYKLQQEAYRERWLKERVACGWCGRCVWPWELESHETMCRERYI